MEEKRFKEECSEEIRHVCQEKIVHYAHETRPAPSYVTPAPAPEPIFTPTPHPYSGPAPNVRDVTTRSDIGLNRFFYNVDSRNAIIRFRNTPRSTRHRE